MEEETGMMNKTGSENAPVSVSAAAAVTAIEGRHVVDEIRGRSDGAQREADNGIIDLTEPRTKWYDKFDWSSVKVDEGKPVVESKDVAETFAVVPAVQGTTIIVDEELSTRDAPIVVDEDFSERNPNGKIIVDEELSARNYEVVMDEDLSARNHTIVVDEELSARKPIVVDAELPLRTKKTKNDLLNQRHVEGTDEYIDAETKPDERSADRKDSGTAETEQQALDAGTDESILEILPTTPDQEPAADTCLAPGFFCDMLSCLGTAPTNQEEPVETFSMATTTMSTVSKETTSQTEITPSETDTKTETPVMGPETSHQGGTIESNMQVHSKATSNSGKAVDPVPDSRKGGPPKPEELKHSPKSAHATEEDEDSIDRKQTDDTDCISEEEILESCRHLKAVPSTKEEIEESVPPMKPADLGKCSLRGTAAFVERKAQELCDDASLNSKLSEASKNPTGKKNKTKVPKLPTSIDARRRTLAKELKNSISSFGRYDLRTANISTSLADVMTELEHHEKATQLLRDAVSIYSCKLGDDHSTTLEAKVRLGQSLELVNEVEAAINMYYQVTVMRRAVQGDRDPSVADGLVCMANALRRKEDYVQAIKELKRALKIYRESLGDSDKKVSATVDEIASLYITIGDFNKAAAILEEVVKLKAATQGTKSRNVASTLLQLASAYECAEDHENALRSMKKAYKIYSEVEGHSSHEATSTLNRMAMLYEATQDFNRAAVAYLGVLRSRKTNFGPTHTKVGETYFHLGKTLRQTRQFDKALKCLKEALPIFVGEGVEIEDVKTVAEIMHEMALTNQDRGKLSDAIRIFKQELSVRRKVGQPEFPYAAKTLKHLGFAEYQMESYNRSLKHLIESLGLYQERGHEGEECAEVLFYTGCVFQKLRNPSRARKALTEAVRMLEDCDTDEDNALMVQAKQKLVALK